MSRTVIPCRLGRKNDLTSRAPGRRTPSVTKTWLSSRGSRPINGGLSTAAYASGGRTDALNGVTPPPLEVDAAAVVPERWDRPVDLSGGHATAPATAVASIVTTAPTPTSKLMPADHSPRALSADSLSILSEGLDVLVLESSPPGGQVGSRGGRNAS